MLKMSIIKTRYFLTALFTLFNSLDMRTVIITIAPEACPNENLSL